VSRNARISRPAARSHEHDLSDRLLVSNASQEVIEKAGAQDHRDETVCRPVLNPLLALLARQGGCPGS